MSSCCCLTPLERGCNLLQLRLEALDAFLLCRCRSQRANHYAQQASLCRARDLRSSSRHAWHSSNRPAHHPGHPHVIMPAWHSSSSMQSTAASPEPAPESLRRSLPAAAARRAKKRPDGRPLPPATSSAGAIWPVWDAHAQVLSQAGPGGHAYSSAETADATALWACSTAYAAQNVEILNALCGLLSLDAVPISGLWSVGWLLLQLVALGSANSAGEIQLGRHNVYDIFYLLPGLVYSSSPHSLLLQSASLGCSDCCRWQRQPGKQLGSTPELTSARGAQSCLGCCSRQRHGPDGR